MNELEIRKIAKEEFINNVMNNLDSTLIFTYIQNLEQKANNLQSKIDKAVEYAKDNLPERDYMDCLLTDEDVTLNRILEKLLNILKEDK